MYPSKEHLGRYRVLITTLVTAGRSEDLGLFPPPMAGKLTVCLATRLQGQPQWGEEEGGQQQGPLVCRRMRTKGV